MQHQAFARLITVGILAGAAGGLAELGWVTLYAAASGSDAALVARGVTDTLRLSTPAPVTAGIAIHMSLAALLGIAVACALNPLRAHLGGLSRDALLVSVLGLIWAVNFLLVLPLVNPGFVEIVPLGVSFVSKLLFGAAAAWSFRIALRPAPVPVRAHSRR